MRTAKKSQILPLHSRLCQAKTSREFLICYFSMLKDAKVSKDDIAEVLLELGLRLKGTELVPELKKVIDNGIDNGVDDHLLLLKQSQTLE